MWLLTGLLLSFVLGRVQAQSLPCAILDADGCCSFACQLAICQSLHSSGQQLGAAGPGVWVNRTGWEAVYSYSGPANAACRQYLSAPTALAANQPAYCSWHGVMCNATAYSACSQSRWTYGVTNITLTNNNLSGYIGDRFATDMKQLHDCGLQSLIIGGASFDLHGTISPQFGGFTQLQTFSIFGTNISGKIPADLGNMTALEVLDLNTDYLTGTIPPELGRLSKLRRLNLAYNGWTDKGEMLTGTFNASWLGMRSIEVLMLDHNAFYGTLPDGLCSSMTALKALSLGNNHFSGSAAQFGNCSGLSILDLSNNNFTGPLPVPNGTAWRGLQSLRLNSNNFTGPLPSFDYGQAPQLSILVLSNNMLTGSIPISWTYLQFLTVVDASFNQITGTVPWQLAFQSRLASLSLNNNSRLSGDLVPMWRFAVGLSSLSLHTTDVGGPLPGSSRNAAKSNTSGLCGSDDAGLGRLPLLQSVDISDTNMTAVCSSEPDGTCSDIDDALPWYLNLDYSAWQIPLPEDKFSTNENMQCPTVIQEKYCQGNGQPMMFSKDTRPAWDVSPSYHHYLGCRCQAGFRDQREKVKHGDVMVYKLTCQKMLTASEIAGISVAVSAVGLALLWYLGYVSWYGRFGLPKLQRAYVDVKKRLVGAPTSGKVSFVVTDVEGYSALMVAMPLVMGKAMSQHNNAVRKAAWAHFGFVVGQEGDSYVLAFSDALDAVAFCLQLQQALRRVDWPPELIQHLQEEEASKLGLTSIPAAPQPPPSRALSLTGRTMGDGSTLRNIFAAVRAGTSTSTGPAGADESGASGDESAAGPPLSRESSRFWSAVSRPQRSSNSGSAASSRGPYTPGPAEAASNSHAQQSLSPAATPLGALQDQQRQQPQIATTTALIPGLRVRIGIATGVLGDKEHDLLSCRVLEVARVISDAATGGQVLIDSTTFRAIKDRLEELGQVGASGYGRKTRVTGWGTPRGWLARLVARHSRSLTAEAQVLDMGMYTIPGFKLSTATDASVVLPELPCWPLLATDTAAPGPATLATAKDPAVGVASRLQQPGEPTAVVASAASCTGDSSNLSQPQQSATAAAEPRTGGVVVPTVTLRKVPCNNATVPHGACLRLYQILAPKLADRAHLFGNKLSLKEGSRCHDLPYFCGPVAANRPTLDADLQQWHSSFDGRRMSNSGSSDVSAFTGNARTAMPAAFSVAGPSAGLGVAISGRWPGRPQQAQLQQTGGTTSAVQDRSGDGGAAGSAAPVVAPAGGVAKDDAVTFVFCSVVMPRLKLTVDTNPKLTAQISGIVGKVIRECLMAFVRTPTDTAGTNNNDGSPRQQAGGYLCRALGGDIKYMLAFHNPRVALEWCLLVQEVLLWQDWPTSLLEKPGRTVDAPQQPLQVLGRRGSILIPTAAAAAAAANAVLGGLGAGNGFYRSSLPAHLKSQPLFRGPRVKMGVCSGAPQAVTPDHQGRADYHGNAVNMAARYEAICAQGGQIVCEASLAQAVVAEWTAQQAAEAGETAAAAQVPSSTAGGAAGPPALHCNTCNCGNGTFDQTATTPATQPQQPRPMQQPSNAVEQPSAVPTPNVSPFQAASGVGARQQQPHVSAQVSPAAATPSMEVSSGGINMSGPWSLSGSPPATAGAGNSLAIAASIPTAGGTVSRLSEPFDAADEMVLPADGTADAAAQAAAAAEHSTPLRIPGRQVSFASSGQLPTAGPNPSKTVAASAPDLAVLKSPASPSTVVSLPPVARAASSGALPMSPGTAGIGISTSGGRSSGFLSRAGAGGPRRSGRVNRSAARHTPLTLGPAPTELACPSCVPELPLQGYGVEVHQVGKFLVKGHSGPVEIVEVLLSHLSARRQLMGDSSPKAQKGRCIQVQSGRIAVVKAVHLPSIAQLYRCQHEQRVAAGLGVRGAETSAQLPAQPGSLSLHTDSLSFLGIQQLAPQQRTTSSPRPPNLLASLMGGPRRFDSGSASSAPSTASPQGLSVASIDSIPAVSAVQGSNRPALPEHPHQQHDAEAPQTIAMGVPASELRLGTFASRANETDNAVRDAFQK